MKTTACICLIFVVLILRYENETMLIVYNDDVYFKISFIQPNHNLFSRVVTIILI